jgi:pimeloyl-ACP methyl ester carboxylesterase
MIESFEDLPTFTVSLHGDDVHYVKAGRGPVLVLIHGILGSRRDWEQLVSLLERDFTVVAPDLLGHGDSAKPRGDYTLGGHAGRLRDLLELLGVRRAFLATIRTVVDPGGQMVSALERLPALAGIPTLLVWGARDRLIPVAHAIAAQQAIPGSRLEVFEKAGHSPHLSDPSRFAALLREFVATTPAPAGDRADGRRRRSRGPSAG